MALALPEEFALVPTGPAAGKRLQLPFGKGQFYVPASAVELAARKISQLDSGTALGQLLYTKTPEKWHDYCHPKHLYKIKDKDGWILDYNGERSAVVHQWDRFHSECVRHIDRLADDYMRKKLAAA